MDGGSNFITSSTVPTTIYAERVKTPVNNFTLLAVFPTATGDSGDSEFSFPWRGKKTFSLSPS
jgi:hypothetical protein